MEEIEVTEPFEEELTDDECAGCGGAMTMGYCDSGCDDYPYDEDDETL